MATEQAEPRPTGASIAQRDAPVGGQAVLEGVMMRGVSTWAVAVRDVEGTVGTQSFPITSASERHRWLRLPVIRGVVALGESLAIGLRALRLSAEAQLPPDEREEITKAQWAMTVVLGLGLAIGLFFLLPAGLTSLSGAGAENGVVFVVVEKVIRVSIFLAYLWLVSRLPHLRRVFEYHGAEHKVIHTYEAGQELTPDNAQRFSRLHPRCGTSFMLIVMILAIVVLAPLGAPEWYILYPSRILAVPIIAGLSFEVLKWFGRNRTRPWARGLMWPGMQLQRLTTREPGAAQLAVAITALEAVLAVETPGANDADAVGMEVAA
ncbi:MAG: DUF1385 domain-containing protein [Actinomycetota bacterium]|nr:DUF1385 domain-containing protein [Actinomycetota bacterium]